MIGFQRKKTYFEASANDKYLLHDKFHVSYAGPKRVQPPGLEISSLPPIDIALITHDHYDHLDIPSLLKLEKKDHPLFLVPMGIHEILQEEDIKNIKPILWWKFY